MAYEAETGGEFVWIDLKVHIVYTHAIVHYHIIKTASLYK